MEKMMIAILSVDDMLMEKIPAYKTYSDVCNKIDAFIDDVLKGIQNIFDSFLTKIGL